MNSRANNSTVFVIALVLASHFAPAECVTVTQAAAPKFLKSSSNLRLTIRRDGQPAPGAMVTFSGYGNTVPNAFSVAADENGVVVFKDLPLGMYSVNALDQNGGGGNVYVDLFRGKKSKITSLDVALEQGYRPTTPIEVANVRSFSGVVVDPSGAQIPAVIFVLKQGTPEKLIDSLSLLATGRLQHTCPPDGTLLTSWRRVLSQRSFGSLSRNKGRRGYQFH
jgi:hypothetical protein